MSDFFALRRNPAYDDSYLRDTSFVDAFPLADQEIPTEGTE